MQNTELFQRNFLFFCLAFRVFRFGVFIFNTERHRRPGSFYAFDNLHFVGILSPKLILSPIFNILNSIVGSEWISAFFRQRGGQ
jgi:hypothetical protein